MATITDTDRLLSDCREDNQQSGNDDVDGCISFRNLDMRMSPDGRKFILIVEQTIPTKVIKNLSKLDQYKFHSQNIYALFASFLDYQRKEDFCMKLVGMFIDNKIEILETSLHEVFINLPKSTGQAELVRLIISYMSPQKQASIHDSTTFNALKNLLLQHLRKQSLAISVNSMSKTLSRAVEQVLKQLPVNPDSQ